MYNWPQRKPLRLKNYDYSSDWFYFVTICTKWREDFFGEIINWKMILNEYGEIMKNEILKTRNIRKEIKIDEFVIMPNHLHLIIIIENTNVTVGCDCIAPDKDIITPNKMWNWVMVKSATNNENIATNNENIAPNKENIAPNNENIAPNNGTMQSFPTKKWWFDINGAIWLKWNNISSVIRWLKSITTSQIRKKYEDFNFWWQKSFFDKIIRNDEQLEKTREYIINNPLKWEFDVNNQINIKKSLK